MRKPRTAATFRGPAERLSKECDINTAPVPIEPVAEHLGASIRNSTFVGEFTGILVRRVCKDTLFGTNSRHHPNRQRLATAHEFGLLIFRRGKVVYIDRVFRVNRRGGVTSQATDPEEIDAYRLAAEIPMPFEPIIRDAIDEIVDVEDAEEIKVLAESYGVSIQALTHRETKIRKNIY